ncbi:MAG TPA: Ig-like domain-containing protein [Solirubrobacterales bacterium]|nr:Ig-like domain-containing protein [Solirubrobacterales bacterium]
MHSPDPGRFSVSRQPIPFLSLLLFALACVAGGVADAEPGEKAAPVVTIEAPTEGLAVSSRSLTISGTVAGDPTLNEVRAFIDGIERGSMGRDGPHAFDIDISELPEGEHTAQLSAFDSSGNRGDSAVRNFTVDRTIPALSKVGGPERGAVVTTRRVKFSYSLGDEPASTELRCAVNGIPLAGLCPLDLEVELENGEHTVAAFAKDLAGNRTVIATTFTVRVPDDPDPDPTCETDPRLCPDPPVDSLAPTVGISQIPGQDLNTLRRGLRLRVRCSEICSGTVRAAGPGGLAFRGDLEVGAPGAVVLRAGPTRRTRMKLLRRNSPVKLKVTAVAADPGGNRSVARRTIRIRR